MYVLNSPTPLPYPFAVSFTALSILALIFVRLLYNGSRVSFSIPGPALAKVSDLWRFYQQNRPEGLRQPLLRLHSKYGPFVRYGVRSVSISHPSAIPVIYGSRAGFVTAPSYRVLVGISKGREVSSLVSTADETQHRDLRRSIASAFTPTGVLALEPAIGQSILDFKSFLTSKSHSRESFNLANVVLLFTMDSAARQAFSESRGYLSSGHDVDGSIALIRARFTHWGRWSSLPGLERLIYRNPISMRRKQTPSSMAAEANRQLSARISTANTEVKPQQDFFEPQRDLLSSFLLASSTNPHLLDRKGIVGMLMSTISGAGDTTASTLTGILFYLMKNPKDMETLRSELDSHNILGKTVPESSEVSKLPFLNAVIKESMRCFSSATWPIERVVPAGGVTIEGTFIPEGTSVGVLPAAVHLNTEIYGSDANIFRPSRWLEANEQTLRAMETSHMGFSRGRRVCLGQNIAVMQMKKTLAVVLQNFEVRLGWDLEKKGLAHIEQMNFENPDAELEADFRPAVATLSPLMVRVWERAK